ncbi:MAG: hypothetical protein IPK16_06070 [Anaerolineales bacterium]|nr:hypothetical protein [Anaerolineales bacterium]
MYWDRNEARTQAESERMATVLKQRMAQLGIAAVGGTVFGPAPAYFARFRGQYRWQVLIRATDPALLLRGLDIPFGWRVDVDPVTVL